jgi:preprotein translocase subunit YajC
MTFLFGLLAAHPVAASILAQTTKTSAKSTGTSGFGAWGLWVILGLMFIVMYFVLYRPQKKRQQEAQDVLTKLRKGDEVVTIGGVHGTIKKLTEDTVQLEVDKGIRMTFSRSAISRTLTVHEEEQEEETAAVEEPEPEETEDLEEPEEDEEYEEYEDEEEEYEDVEDEAEVEEEVEAEAEPEADDGGKKGKK